MENNLFTFIVEYDGATLVSQIRARSHLHALKIWLSETDVDYASAPYIHSHVPEQKTLLEKELLNPDNLPVALDGCINAWQKLFIHLEKTGVMTIVQTSVAK